MIYCTKDTAKEGENKVYYFFWVEEILTVELSSKAVSSWHETCTPLLVDISLHNRLPLDSFIGSGR